jgi:membrane-bound metal-dependent hydrolase YbcI (DUF457 family)
MFIGHFGIGLAAKKIGKAPALGTLFMASQFLDLLWPIFLIFGIEKVKVEAGNTAFTPLNFISYPYSHSFLGALIWAMLFGIIYYLVKRNVKNSILLGFIVLSHWLLDFFTHRPDLPLLPWSDAKYGLGMWNSVALTMFVEILIYLVGIYLYIKSRTFKNIKGIAKVWSLLVSLLIIYLMNIFGPPPPSEHAIGYVGLALWLLVAWAYWADRKTINN